MALGGMAWSPKAAIVAAYALVQALPTLREFDMADTISSIPVRCMAQLHLWPLAFLA